MRSYYKCYTDSPGFPTYLSDTPVNEGDFAIYVRRKSKEQFLADVNELLSARLSANFPGARIWSLQDSFGNDLGLHLDFWTVIIQGPFETGEYSEHPLD